MAVTKRTTGGGHRRRRRRTGVKRHSKKAVKELKVLALRKLAKKMGVAGYSSLSRRGLLLALASKKRLGGKRKTRRSHRKSARKSRRVRRRKTVTKRHTKRRSTAARRHRRR